jgi:hypothetical protein
MHAPICEIGSRNLDLYHLCFLITSNQQLKVCASLPGVFDNFHMGTSLHSSKAKILDGIRDEEN